MKFTSENSDDLILLVERDFKIINSFLKNPIEGDNVNALCFWISQSIKKLLESQVVKHAPIDIHSTDFNALIEQCKVFSIFVPELVATNGNKLSHWFVDSMWGLDFKASPEEIELFLDVTEEWYNMLKSN